MGRQALGDSDGHVTHQKAGAGWQLPASGNPRGGNDGSGGGGPATCLGDLDWVPALDFNSPGDKTHSLYLSNEKLTFLIKLEH